MAKLTEITWNRLCLLSSLPLQFRPEYPSEWSPASRPLGFQSSDLHSDVIPNFHSVSSLGLFSSCSGHPSSCPETRRSWFFCHRPRKHGVQVHSAMLLSAQTSDSWVSFPSQLISKKSVVLKRFQSTKAQEVLQVQHMLLNFRRWRNGKPRLLLWWALGIHERWQPVHKKKSTGWCRLV